MARVVLLGVGIAVAVGAVLFALAWGHPYCVTSPAFCGSPNQTTLCSPALVTTCSSAHVALRVGIAIIGVGAGLVLASLGVRSRPRAVRV